MARDVDPAARGGGWAVHPVHAKYGETGLFSSPAVACNSRENSGVFRRSSRDGRIVSPTAGAVFILIWSAMAAAARHGISLFMLSAGVGAGLPTAYVAHLTSAVYSASRDGVSVQPQLPECRHEPRQMPSSGGGKPKVKVRCRTPRQMRLANAVARLVEMAADPIGDQR